MPTTRASALTGGANQSLDGDVYTNGSIASNGPTYIGGDLSYGGTLTGGPTVSGTVTSNAPFVNMPSAACPIGDFTASVPSPTGNGTLSYSAATGDLTIQQSGNGVSTPSLRPYPYGNQLVLQRRQAQERGDPRRLVRGPARRHLRHGLWQSDAGYIKNTSQKPTLLTIWGCGSSTASPWTVEGGGGPDPDVNTNNAYFAMHAPNHLVTTSHPYDIFGAIVGASFDDSPGAHIHYDKALSAGAASPS